MLKILKTYIISLMSNKILFILRWCYVSFVDYYRCRKLRGDDYEPCDYFKNVYSSICPEYFVERWERWRADGTFLAGV